MRRYESKIVAILGTVIVHLIAAIIFMSFKLYSLKTKEKQTRKFEIEFAAVEEKKAEKKIMELPPTTVENILHGDNEMLNIARNLSNKSDEKIDPKDYINQVKEELIKTGQLGINNYIDDPKERNLKTEDDELALKEQSEKDKIREEEKNKESLRMAANYRGPTRIYYDLLGRNHRYLPIPIYKCQGSGKIVLQIEVNQKGDVENAGVIEGESSTSDECLVETAVRTALNSRFDPSDKAPKIQKGTLTYLFVAQ